MQRRCRMVKRPYEILLPAEFNDGRLVADACPRCIPDSLAEDDRLFALSVDVEDTSAHRDWIAHLKSHLLQRFEQLEIYVTSYPIEVL